VSEINRIHIHAQCVNWSACIRYPPSRACLLAQFCWGLLIVTAEKESDRNIIFRCSFIGYFHGVSYCDNRERGFLFDYDTKEKEHQNTRQSDEYSGATPPRTNQIASCFDALSITSKLCDSIYSLKIIRCVCKISLSQFYILSLFWNFLRHSDGDTRHDVNNDKRSIKLTLCNRMDLQIDGIMDTFLCWQGWMLLQTWPCYNIQHTFLFTYVYYHHLL
jgi:hypothetical protein